MIRRSMRSIATGAARTSRPTCCRFRLRPRRAAASVRAGIARRHRHRLRDHGARGRGRRQAAQASSRASRGARLSPSRRLRPRDGSRREADGDGWRANPRAASACPILMPPGAPTQAVRRAMPDSAIRRQESTCRCWCRARARPRRERESIFARIARALFGWRSGTTRADLEVVLEAAVPGETGVSPAERTMLMNILALRERRIEDVMVPRADIVAVQQDISLGELIKVFQIAAHSRLVVFNDTLDDPIGMVHIRDLIAFMATRAAVDADKNAKRKKPLPSGLDLKAVDLAMPLSATGIVRDHPVRAAVDAGARPARQDADHAHPARAGGRRIRRHRRARLDGGHRRGDRRRDLRRARRGRQARRACASPTARSSPTRAPASTTWPRRSARSSTSARRRRRSIRWAAT